MIKLLVGAAAGLTLVAGAQASTIEMSTRFDTTGPLSGPAAYQSHIDSLMVSPASSGYGNASPSAYDNLSNALFGSSSNIAFRFTVDFGVTPAEAGTWQFRSGVDFGHGGAAFLDGTAVAYNPNNMWWGGSYNDPSQYFQFASPLGAGEHELVIYGMEDCCDGGQQAQFMAPGKAFTTFSATDGLDPVQVPEPISLAVFGTGLAGLGLLRRRRRS